MKRFLLSLLTAILLASCYQSSHVEYQTGSIASIFSRAKEENKKVFILFENNDCNICSAFVTRIDSQAVAVNELNDHYISYRVNVQDSQALAMAQIIKCPSYPFPYFFNSDGNLEAFGFPNNPMFDVRNLANVTVAEFKFQELFRLPISTSEYKTLVSQNVKAYLLLQQAGNNTAITQQAYELNKASLSIATYPYNVYLHEVLSKQLNIPMILDSFTLPELKNSDRLIYRNLHLDSSYFTRQALPLNSSEPVNYQVSPQKLSLANVKNSVEIPFRFQVKNTGKEPLVIKEIGHPCTCINVEWSKAPLAPDSVTYISGIFQTPTAGSFQRELYLHTNSTTEPMKTLWLSGNVK